MTPSSDLFDLIKSLTKSEKRYFKLSASIQSGTKVYLELFDAIESASVYDEAKIKEKFKKEPFIRQLPAWKNYLYKHILKSLNAYHVNNSIDAQLHDMIQSAQNLIDKGLDKQSLKILSKAEEIASRHESFSLLVEIKRLIRATIVTHGTDLKKIPVLTESLNAEKVIIEKQNNINQYETLASQLVFFHTKYGSAKKDKSAAAKFLQNPLLKDPKNALSTRAYRSYLRVHSLFCTMTRNPRKSAFYISKSIELYEKDPELLQAVPKGYIITLGNFLSMQSAYEKHDRIEATFLKLINFIEKPNQKISEAYKIKAILFAYINLINSCIVKADFMGGVKFVSQLQTNLEIYLKKSDTNNKILLSYNIAYCYFGTGNYHLTLKWLNKVLNNNVKDFRYDIQTHIRILHFITHYELGNTEILESLAKSTHRYINKKIKFLYTEAAVVNFISRRLSGINNKEKYREALKNFKMELLNDYNLSVQDYGREMFDIISWLDSKIEKRTYADALKSRIEKSRSSL